MFYLLHQFAQPRLAWFSQQSQLAALHEGYRWAARPPRQWPRASRPHGKAFVKKNIYSSMEFALHCLLALILGAGAKETIDRDAVAAIEAEMLQWSREYVCLFTLQHLFPSLLPPFSHLLHRFAILDPF